MIAALEQTYQGYTFLARSREEGEVVQRLAAFDEGKAARVEATEHLLRTIRELSRPMGGKPWTNRDELYER